MPFGGGERNGRRDCLAAISGDPAAFALQAPNRHCPFASGLDPSLHLAESSSTRHGPR